VRAVNVAWDAQAEQFKALGTHRGSEIVINAPEAALLPSGTHRAPTGFSATELLLAGVGACSAWDIVEILRKQRQDMTGLSVRVEGTQDEDAPWAYRRIAVHYTVRGRGLDEAQIGRAVRLSVDRYCSVLATLRGAVEIADTVEIVEEPVEPAA
jgi:putative redox protein